MQCYVCHTHTSSPVFTKKDVPYFYCRTCETIFSKHIPSQVIKTENDKANERNKPSLYHTQLDRITKALGKTPRNLLDFGCGDGTLVEYTTQQEIESFGIDKRTQLQVEHFPKASFDAVTMIEVIEHLYDPVSVFKKLNWVMREGGVIYVESTFIDTILNPETDPYVDPSIGHCCIHSKQSIAHIARQSGFEPQWLNQNVVILKKKQNIKLFWMSMRKSCGFVRRRLGLY